MSRLDRLAYRVKDDRGAQVGVDDVYLAKTVVIARSRTVPQRGKHIQCRDWLIGRQSQWTMLVSHTNADEGHKEFWIYVLESYHAWSPLPCDVSNMDRTDSVSSC